MAGADSVSANGLPVQIHHSLHQYLYEYLKYKFLFYKYLFSTYANAG